MDPMTDSHAHDTWPRRARHLRPELRRGSLLGRLTSHPGALAVRTSSPLGLALFVSLSALGACGGGGGGGNTPPVDADVPDVDVADQCGTLSAIDEPAVFVGSCIGSGGCTEVTTKPHVPIIGTPCQRDGCLMSAGNSWSTERCGSMYTYCSSLVDPDGLRYDSYVIDPRSCPPMP